eukprot:GEMP01035077.1.p1 GENE.GEMP01035077.1~~GEMP01035077.1.p1  ORF type:complete len:467 (+),score=102.60 GEMP01035077.1:95-1495(+)
MMECQWDDGRSPAAGLLPTPSHFIGVNNYEETDRSPCRHAFLSTNSGSFTLSTTDDARDDASAAPSQVSGTFSCAVTDEASVGDISARGESSYRERMTGMGNTHIEPEKSVETQGICVKQPVFKVDALEKLPTSLLQRPKKQVTFSRQRGVKVTRLQQPITSPRSPDPDATPASPSSPCFPPASRRRQSPPPPAHCTAPSPDDDEESYCSSTAPSPNRLSRSSPSHINNSTLRPMEPWKSDGLLAVPLRATSVTSSTSMGGAEGEGHTSISPSPSVSPMASPRVRTIRRHNTCPARRPKDFPLDFAIQPKIEEFEKRADNIALDEETLKQFDVANRPVRRLHRSQTVPVPDPDDWWGVQSAPSEGSDGDVVCEYFAIGTPPGGRSRASSVCSLGSIYSRSSRGSSRSSRSMRSARSAISSSSLYNCSSNGSNASLYSSDGSLYDETDVTSFAKQALQGTDHAIDGS